MTTITITASVRSVVIGSDSIERLSAYLYGHTKVVFAAKSDARIYAVVETSVSTTKELGHGSLEGADLPKRCADLATYQCERFQSGLYFAIVAGTEDEAFFALAQQVRDEDRNLVCDEYEKATT